MSRDDGFAVADLSTDLLDDPKVKALWRDLGDQGRMGHALTLYTATVLASWKAGARVPVTDAAPVWLVPDETLVSALTAAKLLDRTGRIPIKAWKSWFGPAADRREKLRTKWRRANEKRAVSTNSGTAAVPPPPYRPSVRQDRPSDAHAREATAQRANGRRGGPPVPIAELVTPEALIAGGRKP